VRGFGASALLGSVLIAESNTDSILPWDPLGRAWESSNCGARNAKLYLANKVSDKPLRPQNVERHHAGRQSSAPRPSIFILCPTTHKTDSFINL
jgi:hypothetical protein